MSWVELVRPVSSDTPFWYGPRQAAQSPPKAEAAQSKPASQNPPSRVDNCFMPNSSGEGSPDWPALRFLTTNTINIRRVSPGVKSDRSKKSPAHFLPLPAAGKIEVPETASPSFPEPGKPINLPPRRGVLRAWRGRSADWTQRLSGKLGNET